MSGRIDLAGLPPGRVMMLGVPADGVTARFAVAAPVSPDGSAISSTPGRVLFTVCAYTLGGDLASSGPWMRLRDHADQLAVTCAPVEPDARVVILAVPPQPRLDGDETAR